MRRVGTVYRVVCLEASVQCGHYIVNFVSRIQVFGVFLRFGFFLRFRVFARCEMHVRKKYCKLWTGRLCRFYGV